MKTLRTEEEIREYLMINNNGSVEEKLVADAIQVEKKYVKELMGGVYEYSTYADYHNCPNIMEDENVVKELKFIEQIGGVVVYEPVRMYKNVHLIHKLHSLSDQLINLGDDLQDAGEFSRLVQEIEETAMELCILHTDLTVDNLIDFLDKHHKVN